MPLFSRYNSKRISQMDLRQGDFARDIGSALNSTNNGISVYDSGQKVNEDSAFEASPFAAAVRLISNQGARFPLQIIDIKKDEVDHDLNVAWLRRDPCLGFTPFQWKKMILTSLLIRGVAFVSIENWIKRNGKMYPDVLKPLPSRYVTTNNQQSQKGNRYKDGVTPVEILFNPTEKLENHTSRRFTEWLGPNDPTMKDEDGLTNRCIIIRFDDDGSIEGRNPVISSRSVLGVALAAQHNAGLYFQNGGDMSGIAAFEDVSDSEILRQKISFYRDKRNPDHRGGVLFTNRPVSFVSMNLNAQEQQLIESREFSVEEISRLYNIPAPMLGAASTSWGTGMQAIERFTHNYAVMPYLKSLTDYLIWTLPRKYEVEFNSKDYHFDDPRTSVELLTKAVGGPYMTQNEARSRSRLVDVEGGDILLKTGVDPEEDEDSSDKGDRSDRDASRDKSGKTDK